MEPTIPTLASQLSRRSLLSAGMGAAGLLILPDRALAQASLTKLNVGVVGVGGRGGANLAAVGRRRTSWRSATWTTGNWPGRQPLSRTRRGTTTTAG